jgi:hypothetical protein
MKEVTIERAHVSTVSISGEMNDEAKAQIAMYLKIANQYKGEILRRKDFEDGVFLEIRFKNEATQKVWESYVGLNK